jgi:hypothetical protein
MQSAVQVFSSPAISVATHRSVLAPSPALPPRQRMTPRARTSQAKRRRSLSWRAHSLADLSCDDDETIHSSVVQLAIWKTQVVCDALWRKIRTKKTNCVITGSCSRGYLESIFAGKEP